MGSTESSLDKFEKAKEKTSKTTSSSIYSKKDVHRFIRINTKKINLKTNDISTFINNKNKFFEKLLITNIEIHLVSLKNIIDLQWLVHLEFKGNEVMRMDYNHQGPVIDLSENFKFLEDQRKPVKIIYKTSANQEFNDIIAERLHEVSNLHLKIDKTYDLYSNNSRHYATLIFDYFVCNNLFDKFDRLKEFLIICREYHYFMNHFHISSKSKLVDLGKEKFNKMVSLSEEAANRIKIAYEIN